MELHINEDYIMLNQRLQHQIMTGKIDKADTMYVTMENGLVDDYYADINDVPGQVAGMMTALELSRELFKANFR
ncbi:hypothetical protein [Salinicoccus sp. HZC-1]|uniref:hypothetical protein n=1 Tax=Salinicoccus sp. HZC-1 TaxID=3385497 RepID=UPI00398B220C